jgi:hypothetical protein
VTGAETDQSYLAAGFLLLLAALYPFVALQRHRSRRLRERALDRFARRVQLPVPEGLRPRIAEQLAAHHLGADLGGGAGVALVAVWGLTLGRSVVGSNWWALVVVGAVLAGSAVGAGVATLRRAWNPRREPGPRVARPTSPGLGDYLAPVELQGGRAAAVLPALVVLVLAAVALTGVGSPPLLLPAGLALLAASALVVAELGARRILDAPQAAGSDLELAWSDALRAHTLRAVVTVPIAVGSYASAGLLAVLGLEVADPRSVTGVVLLALAALVGLAVVGAAAWTLTGAPHRYFRRRLWPADGGPAGRQVAEVRA